MKNNSFFSTFIESVFDNFQESPKGKQILTYLLIFFVPIVIFTWFSYLPKNDQLNLLKKKQMALEHQLSELKKKTRGLDKFQAEIKDAEKKFKIATKVLPDKSEIPSLLDGISRSGHDSGLEFVLFKPQPNILKDFYVEIPVAIKVRGNFHNVASFFHKVTRLPRIVNINNISMTPQKESETLITSCTAVTYKFVETKEVEDKKKDRKKK